MVENSLACFSLITLSSSYSVFMSSYFAQTKSWRVNSWICSWGVAISFLHSILKSFKVLFTKFTDLFIHFVINFYCCCLLLSYFAVWILGSGAFCRNTEKDFAKLYGLFYLAASRSEKRTVRLISTTAGIEFIIAVVVNVTNLFSFKAVMLPRPNTVLCLLTLDRNYISLFFHS